MMSHIFKYDKMLSYIIVTYSHFFGNHHIHEKFRNSCYQLLILLSIVEEALLRIHLSSQTTKEAVVPMIFMVLHIV